MKLLYPEFLWALSALSIPIIIHLFNFRKFQKVYFSNVELLKEVKLETKSKSQLKHLIVLLIRLVAITLLVFAFAQPYVPVGDQEEKGSRIVSVYIDNSHSMDTKGENGYLLDLAKEQAISIANSYEPTDKFQLITNDLEGRHQRIVSKDDFIQLVDEVEPTYVSRNLDEIYTRQTDALSDQEQDKTIYWLSDFQKNMVHLEEVQPDSNVQVFLLPYSQPGKGNLYIDSVWFENPLRTFKSEDKVFARVVNKSDNPVEFKMELFVNQGTSQGFSNQTVPENSTINCEIPYTLQTPGYQQCRLNISEYPDPDMKFDDEFFFSYNIKGKINILHLFDQKQDPTDTTGFIENVFRNNSMFNLSSQSLSQIDYSTLSSFDLIILSEVQNFTSGITSELNNYCNNGGSILVFPHDHADGISYNSFIGEMANGTFNGLDTNDVKVAYLNSEHPLYANVFDKIPENVNLPKTLSHYPVNFPINSGTEYLMKLENNLSFLSMTPIGKGKFYLFAVPTSLEYSNLAQHALFVASLLRIGEFSQPPATLSYTIGESNSVSLTQGSYQSEKMKVKEDNGDLEFIPELRTNRNEVNLLLYDQIKFAGHFSVFQEQSKVGAFSFNYNREESDLSYYGKEELESLIAKSALGKHTKIIEGADGAEPVNVIEFAEGKFYWWLLLFLAVIFLGIEILLLRIWKTR